MPIEKNLDDILNTKSKVKILRLFTSRTSDFMASGREIAALIGVSPPAAHSALKELYNLNILKREIIGKQHLYKINSSNRTVKDILQPAFRKEVLIKEDIKNFLLKKIKDYKIGSSIVSLIFYGSITKGKTHQNSDCDVAVITKDSFSKKRTEDVFIGKIYSDFYKYFGFSLDTYIKTLKEFRARRDRNLTPVSALMKSYNVIYGVDPHRL